MARRSAAQSQTASHFPPTGGRYSAYEIDSDETALQRFMREQIWNPQYLPGNISIAMSLGLFVGGILAVRKWGDLLVLA